MSEYTEYFEEEYGISLEDNEVLALCENYTLGLPTGICAGLTVKWIMARLNNVELTVDIVSAPDDPILISRMSRIKGGLIHRLYGRVGTRKFARNDGNQEQTDRETLQAIFTSQRRLVGIDHQCAIADDTSWTRLQRLKGVYFISAKKAQRGHAMGAHLSDSACYFFDSNNFLLKFSSRDRFFSILQRLTKVNPSGPLCIDFTTWAWYRIM